MNEDRTARASEVVGQLPGMARRMGRKVRDLVGRPEDPDEAIASGAAKARTGGKGTSELGKLQAAGGRAQAELDALTAERDELRAERLRIQQVLGEQHGKRVLPRLRVEKTNGVPSFVIGQRMMQRIHRRADNPTSGIDGVGAVFSDPAATAAFARSHGVPVVEDVQGSEGQGSPAGREREVIVHAFKGEVGLVEVRGPQGVRHFEADGSDPGDIRPGATYVSTLEPPTALADLSAWSQTLSGHIPRPYVQLSWREDGDTVRLDRIDVDPDRIPILTEEWDRRLGSAFDHAYTRFLLQPFRAGALDNRVPGGTFTYEEAL